MILLQAILWFIVVPLILVVVGLVWLWLGSKLLAHMLGG